MRGKLLKGLGVATEKPALPLKFISRRHLIFAACGAALALGLGLAIDSITGGGAIAHEEEAGKNDEESVLTGGLEIELVKPFESFKEGLNTYVMVSGSIMNTTAETLAVPKLAILLLNREKRIMQEQVREIDAKTLGPGESVHFKYRVLRFSDKVEKVRVVFADENKI
jgi:hypothetical protein